MEDLRPPGEGCHCIVQISWSPTDIEHSKYLQGDKNKVIILGEADEEIDVEIEHVLERMRIKSEHTFVIQQKTYSVQVILHLDSYHGKLNLFEWSDKEKYELALKYKQQGAELFTAGYIAHAFHKYSKSLKICLTSDAVLENKGEYLKDMTHLKATLYNNLALCQLKCKSFSQVIQLSDKSLKVHPTVKAYYKKACAFVELGELDQATNECNELLDLEPNNKAALQKLQQIQAIGNEQEMKYRTAIKQMFRIHN